MTAFESILKKRTIFETTVAILKTRVELLPTFKFTGKMVKNSKGKTLKTIVLILLD
jgi:hypothetical protein